MRSSTSVERPRRTRAHPGVEPHRGAEADGARDGPFERAAPRPARARPATIANARARSSGRRSSVSTSMARRGDRRRRADLRRRQTSAAPPPAGGAGRASRGSRTRVRPLASARRTGAGATSPTSRTQIGSANEHAAGPASIRSLETASCLAPALASRPGDAGRRTRKRRPEGGRRIDRFALGALKPWSDWRTGVLPVWTSRKADSYDDPTPARAPVRRREPDAHDGCGRDLICRCDAEAVMSEAGFDPHACRRLRPRPRPGPCRRSRRDYAVVPGDALSALLASSPEAARGGVRAGGRSAKSAGARRCESEARRRCAPRGRDRARALGGEIGLAGLGAPSFERWGDALVVVLAGSPLGGGADGSSRRSRRPRSERRRAPARAASLGREGGRARFLLRRRAGAVARPQDDRSRVPDGARRSSGCTGGAHDAGRTNQRARIPPRAHQRNAAVPRAGARRSARRLPSGLGYRRRALPAEAVAPSRPPRTPVGPPPAIAPSRVPRIPAPGSRRVRRRNRPLLRRCRAGGPLDMEFDEEPTAIRDLRRRSPQPGSDVEALHRARRRRADEARSFSTKKPQILRPRSISRRRSRRGRGAGRPRDRGPRGAE